MGRMRIHYGWYGYNIYVLAAHFYFVAIIVELLRKKNKSSPGCQKPLINT